MADAEDWGRTLFEKSVLPQTPSRKNFDLIESLPEVFPVAVSETTPIGVCSQRRVRQAMDAWQRYTLERGTVRGTDAVEDGVLRRNESLKSKVFRQELFRKRRGPLERGFDTPERL